MRANEMIENPTSAGDRRESANRCRRGEIALLGALLSALALGPAVADVPDLGPPGTGGDVLEPQDPGGDQGDPRTKPRRPPNYAPFVTPMDDVAATEGLLVQLVADAVDPEGTKIGWDARNLPPGSRFDKATGQFEWIPTNFQGDGHPSVYDVVLIASDGVNETESTVRITVDDDPDLLPFVESVDGVRLSFAPDGSIADFVVRGESFLDGSQPSGVFVRDFTDMLDLAPNLLDNGSFEELTESLPAGWFVQDLQGEAVFTLSEESAAGDWALKLSTGGNLEDRINVTGPWTEVEPGKEYILTLKFKTEHGFNGWSSDWASDMTLDVRVDYETADGEFLKGSALVKPGGSSPNYVQFSTKFSVPPEAVSAQFSLLASGRIPNSSGDPVVVWFDDLRLIERPEWTHMRFPSGTLSQGYDELDRPYVRFLSDDAQSGLSWQVDYIGLSDRIEIVGQVFNTHFEQPERAFDTGVVLAVDAVGHRWHSGVAGTQTILGDQFALAKPLYLDAANIDLRSPSALTMSYYPLSAVSIEDTTLTYGIPIDEPSVYVLYYDALERHYVASFNRGISPYSIPPGETYFSLYLSAPDPGDWGFRAAIQQYYDIYADAFAPHTRSDGQSLQLGGTAMTADYVAQIPDPDRYRLRFVRSFYKDFTPNEIELLAELDNLDIQTLSYERPGDESIVLEEISGTPPNYSQILEKISDIADNNREVRSTLGSAVHNRNGDIEFGNVQELCKVQGAWSVRFPVNLDLTSTEEVESASDFFRRRMAYYQEEAGPGRIDGYTMDGMLITGSTWYDFAPEALAASPHPLAFDLHAYKPAVHTYTSTIEFARLMRESQPELLLGGNVNSNTKTFFAAPYMSLIGYESNLGDGELSLLTNEVFSLRRMIAKHKPLVLRATLPCDGGEDITVESYEEYERDFLVPLFDRTLLFAINPSVPDLLTDLAGLNPNIVDPLELAMPLHDQYMPLFDALQTAGWEPLTLAEVVVADDESKLFVERYGMPEHGEVYYVVFNDAAEGEAQGFSLQVDLASLGFEYLAEVESVTEVLTDTPVGVQGWDTTLVIPDFVESIRARAYRIQFAP